MMTEKSSLEIRAEEELKRINAVNLYDGLIEKAVLELLKVFSEQEHSGGSASITRDLFMKLSDFQPLAPLRGTDDEWVKTFDGGYQNRRCAHVFKDENGRSYDIEGIIFRYPDGSCYTGKASHVDIEFPYTPTREYVDVEG